MPQLRHTRRTSLALAAFTAAVLGAGTVAQARPSILYTLEIGQNNGNTTGVPGFWTLYADDTSLPGEDGGIAGMKVTLVGGGTLTSVTDLPMITYIDSSLSFNNVPAAFQMFRSAINQNPISAMQDTVSGESWVVAGFGHTSGNLSPIPASLQVLGYDSTSGATQPIYAAHLKIAHGTYTVGQEATFGISSLSFDIGGFLLPPDATSGMQSITTITPTYSISVFNTVPEPASLALAVPGILLLLRRGRREMRG